MALAVRLDFPRPDSGRATMANDRIILVSATNRLPCGATFPPEGIDELQQPTGRHITFVTQATLSRPAEVIVSNVEVDTAIFVVI